MGDTITSLGWLEPAGFIHLIDQALILQGKQITVIPCGGNGDTSKELLGRIKGDVLDKKPDWMVLSCGLTDAWYGDRGVSIEDYAKNVESMIDQAKQAGIKVLVVTATLGTEDPDAASNKKVQAYNGALISIAKDKNVLIADVYPMLQSDIAKQKADNVAESGNLLTTDGIHLNGIGNQIVASSILSAWGVSDENLAQAHISWDEVHDAMVLPPVTATVRQYREMMALAAKRGCALDRWENDTVKAPLPVIQVTLPKPPPASPAPNPKH